MDEEVLINLNPNAPKMVKAPTICCGLNTSLKMMAPHIVAEIGSSIMMTENSVLLIFCKAASSRVSGRMVQINAIPRMVKS